MKRYRNDPYWLTVKYPAACRECGMAIPKGVRAYYYPISKTVLCAGYCGQTAAADFAAAAEDESCYGAA